MGTVNSFSSIPMFFLAFGALYGAGLVWCEPGVNGRESLAGQRLTSRSECRGKLAGQN